MISSTKSRFFEKSGRKWNPNQILENLNLSLLLILPFTDSLGIPFSIFTLELLLVAVEASGLTLLHWQLNITMHDRPLQEILALRRFNGHV
jgi:hypothetical protein